VRKLSNLKALQAFEAAARHQSYVGAAEELRVTPAAVGQLVRSLEQWLDKPVFQRHASGSQRLTPTSYAALALSDLSVGFDKLDSALRHLRTVDTSRQLIVSMSQAFAAKWLMPRLERFTIAHPNIDVRLDICDRLVDLQHGEADVAIRCGNGEWPNVYSVRMLDEEIFPVCSPDYLRGRKLLSRPQDLLKTVLIHDVATQMYPAFPTWQRWLAKSNVALHSTQKGLAINSSGMVIQAAINGQGVALARSVLVSDDLHGGKLIRLFPELTYQISWGYFLAYPAGITQTEKVAAFINWIQEEAKKAANR
jgi:LysR family transcriptional regulator, glycine cleavage system transcriptional activator